MQTTIPTLVGFAKMPWNKGRLIGQMRPLKPKEVWAIRVRLQLEGRKRDLALFNLAIDSKLRDCDLVSLRVDDVCVGGRVRDRATVIQKKTGRPVQFEITEQTQSAVRDWLFEADLRAGRYLFPSRFRAQPHLSTRQYARIVHSWVAFVRMRARHHCVVRRELGSSAALGGDLQLRQFNARFNLPGCERKH
jgi:integrase